MYEVGNVPKKQYKSSADIDRFGSQIREVLGIDAGLRAVIKLRQKDLAMIVGLVDNREAQSDKNKVHVPPIEATEQPAVSVSKNTKPKGSETKGSKGSKDHETKKPADSG